jgi:hypothetical protein
MKDLVLKFILSGSLAGALLVTNATESKPVSYPSTLPVRQVSLSALAPEFVAALKNQEFSSLKGRYQIGLGRAFDQPVIVDPKNVPTSEWLHQPDGSRVWSLQVTSEGALGTRLHLEALHLPPGATIRVYDPQRSGPAPQVVTPIEANREHEVWTETVFAPTVIIECRVPATNDTAQVSFTASGLSHLYLMPTTTSTSNLKEGTCHNDVTCYPAYADEASGVARITFIDGGNSYLCTGCLLDSSGSDNFFLTAHHCITSQTIASSMECFWFYQTSTCNGAAPALSSVPHTTGGGELLAGSTDNDFTFMRLHQTPPSGAARLKWSTSTPTSSETLAGIHHPTGAYKRISFGRFLDSDTDYWAVRWTSGVTEPGSSGSPLFNGNHEVIGQLNGGWNGPGSSCPTPSAPDQYGRFDQTYAKIQSWLGGGGGGGDGGGSAFPSGTYYGLFSDTSNPTSMESSGYATITESKKGKFSGKLQAGTRRYAFHGQFAADGSAQVHVSRGFFKGLDMSLQFDNSTGADQITGIVTDGDWQAEIVLNRNAFDGRNNTPAQQGKYTLIIPGNPGATDNPGGDSYATVSVDKAGKIKLAGSLADGTKFTQSTVMSQNGDWPLYVGLYSGQGSLMSYAKFNGDGNAPNGTVNWIKLQTYKTRYYKSGFTVGATMVSSTYIKPGAGSPALSMNDGQVVLAGGDLSDTSVNPIEVVGSRAVSTGDNRLILVFATAAGTFSGRVMDANSGLSLPFRGVVLQAQNRASGYFTGPTETGEVTVQPTD